VSLIVTNGGPGAEPPEKFLKSPNPPLKIQKIGGRGERIIRIDDLQSVHVFKDLK